MKKNTIALITVLMSVSLFGICGLEWYWISKAIEEKAAEFDRAALSAMHSSVAELENAEVVSLIFEQFGEARPAIHVEYEEADGGEGYDVEFYTGEEYRQKQALEGAKGEFIIKKQNSLTTTTWTSEDGNEYSEQIIMNNGGNAEVHTKVIVTTEGLGEEDIQVFSAKQLDRKVRVIEDAMQNVLIEEIGVKPSVESRLGDTNLDSLLQANFQREGIDVPFVFAIEELKADTVIFYTDDAPAAQAAMLDFEVPLFPEFPEDVSLQVGFPSKEVYVLKSLGGVLILVLLFSLLMIATFAKTLHAIVQQKKLAEVKSDFINNMTHEFKTPLATIGLAVDSIRHPQVKNDPAQIDRFTGIISEENKRLNGHVEKILQLAKMDNGELVAKPEPCDINQLVADAVASMELRVQNREGSLEFDSDPTEGLVNVDCNHLYNVVVNLIDNALKYTEAKPEIRVKLWRTAGFISLTVQDNGIGMSNETQKKAFDSFYRAQSGDVHNVKGFGVGLSYVKEIVRLHHGEIIIRSALGKGSTVGFKIPVNGE